jgi:hypothetical protein
MSISKLLIKVDPEMVISLGLHRMFRSRRLEIESELDTEKLDFISAHTKPGGMILEFGSGGSTLELLNRGFQVTSLETDRFFANEVNRVAHLRFNSRPVVFLNIGPTGNHGYPATVLKRINHSMGRFRRYVNYPAKMAFDTVIIDGRFRVAAFLSCVKNMEKLPNLIAIDDFQDREEYQILNKYINFEGGVNGMQYFFPKSQIGHASLEKCLAEFTLDPR